MVVVASSSVPRTFLDAVNRVVSMSGEDPVTTLLNPSRRISNAMRAVSDARDEIFYDRLWEWRRGFWQISLVASQMWYLCPSDYAKLARFVSRNNKGESAISYVDYDDLSNMFPDIRLFPPGLGGSGGVTTAQAVGQSWATGTPDYCTTSNGYLGLYPTPDADFMVAEDNILVASYWRDAPQLSGDNDGIGLPQSLLNAHHKLALAEFRKSLEFADWAQDKQDGLRMLHKVSAAPEEPQDQNIGFNPSINYNE